MSYRPSQSPTSDSVRAKSVSQARASDSSPHRNTGNRFYSPSQPSITKNAASPLKTLSSKADAVSVLDTASSISNSQRSISRSKSRLVSDVRRKRGAGVDPSLSQPAAKDRTERMDEVNQNMSKKANTIPLLVILLFECILIIGVFVTLISVTSVRMSATTRDLVKNRIEADLRYIHASVQNPIESSAKVIKMLALRYRDESQAAGRSYCSEADNTYVASTDFYCEMIAVLDTYPVMDYAYAVVRDRANYSHITAECGMGMNNIYSRNGTTYMNSPGLQPSLAEARAGFVDSLNGKVVNDHRPYGNYIFNGLSFTDFGWYPYFWIDVAGNVLLLLGGYAPLELSYTLADGVTVVSYYPDLNHPQPVKHNTSLTSLGYVAGDIRLAHLNDLLKSVTPNVAGAHTSMYNMQASGWLLSTTADILLYDANQNMWPSGGTPSEDVNRAYRFANPQPLAPGELVAKDQTSYVEFTSDRVISTIRISGDSGIDFVVVQSTPAGFYMDAVTGLRTLMIVLGVVAAVVVVAVCVGMVMAIRTTISELQAGMELAALLKNDRVMPCRSVMTELDHLCLAFGQMNAKLGAARAFMPQSMLLTDTDPETEGDGEAVGEDEEGDAHTRSSASVQSPADRKRKNTYSRDAAAAAANDTSNDDHTYTTTGPNASTYHAHHRRAGAAHTAHNPWQSEAGLAMKRVTVLCVNARGFHQAVTGGASVTALTTELTSTVQALSAQARGVIDSFHGDHFIVSFNAAKTNAQGPAMAVQCGLELAGALGGAAAALSFAMGVATGRAAVGHLGSNDLKRFSIVGKVFSRAAALERLCKRVAEEGVALAVASGACAHAAREHAVQLLTDSSVAPDIEHSYFLQVVGKVAEASLLQAYVLAAAGDGGASKDLVLGEAVLYAVRGCSSSRQGEEHGDEWLYEIKQEGGEGYDPVLPAVNRAMLQFLGRVGARAVSSAAPFTESAAMYPPDALADLRAELRRIGGRSSVHDGHASAPTNAKKDAVTLFRNDEEYQPANEAHASTDPEASGRAQLRGFVWGQLALKRAAAIAEGGRGGIVSPLYI